MKKPGFKIYTLGRKVNQYDSSSLKAKLIAAGFVMAEADATAKLPDQLKEATKKA